MIIVGMSVIATVVVLQYHHHDPNGGNMPKWVRLAELARLIVTSDSLSVIRFGLDVSDLMHSLLLMPAAASVSFSCSAILNNISSAC